MVTNRRAPAFMVAVLAISSGCATGGAVQVAGRPVSAGTWANSAQGIALTQAPDLSRWWEQLGDPTLTGLIDLALKGSVNLRTAQARLRQARAERGVVRADLVPTVSGTASATDRYHIPETYTAGFDAGWEPDVFGGTRSAVAAASADVRATAADLYATQVSLVAEVARNYAELRTSQGRLDIARRNEATQAETLELTGFRAQAGLVSSVDVEQARTNLEQTRAQIPTLDTSIAQSIHRLATLAGLEPSALVPQLSRAAALPAVPVQVAAGIPAETLRQRPDVRAAEERILAETARLAQAKTRRYPRFSLSGSIGTEILTGALAGGPSFVSSAAASLLQTIFDGGRIRQQIAVQSAVQEQAVDQYDATVLLALEDVENALVSFEKSRQRLASLTAAADAAGDAELLARSQYAAGLADFQRVLDTQRTLLSVQDSVATTEGDRLTALIQLYKALGGGWTPAAGDALTKGKTES